MAHEDPKDKRPERQGIIDPAILRPVLETVDTAVTQVLALRAHYHDTVQDAFTPLRSSSQIFREMFYRVELPVKSIEDLIKRAGGPLRLIRVSYPMMGSRLFALADIVAAIPNFSELFPVKNLRIFADGVEDLRERVHGDGPWFVADIENRHLERALEQARKTKGGLTHIIDGDFGVDPCAVGKVPTPAECVTRCLGQLEPHVPVERWTGRSVNHSPKKRGE